MTKTISGEAILRAAARRWAVGLLVAVLGWAGLAGYALLRSSTHTAAATITWPRLGGSLPGFLSDINRAERAFNEVILPDAGLGSCRLTAENVLEPALRILCRAPTAEAAVRDAEQALERILEPLAEASRELRSRREAQRELMAERIAIAEGAVERLLSIEPGPDETVAHASLLQNWRQGLVGERHALLLFDAETSGYTDARVVSPVTLVTVQRSAWTLLVLAAGVAFALGVFVTIVLGVVDVLAPRNPVRSAQG